jgi:hypothetical protein
MESGFASFRPDKRQGREIEVVREEQVMAEKEKLAIEKWMFFSDIHR